MSYSDLIQRDNPAIVWSLDDTDTTVRPDSFMYKSYTNNTTRTYYTGTYSNVVKTGFPLIYGGKQSIKITSDSGYIRVPSLDKMSLKDSRNSSSLEFWVKLSSSSNEMSTLMYKKDVDNSALDDYATSIYVKNDYIVFRLGIVTKYYEVSVPIDTTNKPLHIVANYSKEAITLIVNGVSKTKSIFNPDSLFPVYDASDEYFYFSKPDLVAMVEYDCISLYSYSLEREKALKHFVYGTGYSLPSEIVNSNGGVFYNFSMDGHKEINKYDMGPGTDWSITEADNCLIENGLLTIKKKQEPTTYFAENTSILDTSLFTASNTYSFVSGSYLEIENINSIIPDSIGGWAAKFDGGTYGASEKVLLSIASNSSQDYIEFYVINQSGTNKINVDVNGTITTLKTGHSLATEFYVGYYKDITGTSNVFFLTNGSQVVTPLTLPEIPSAYARFGSDNVWFDGEDITKLDISTGISNSKLLKIVGVHKDNASLYDTYGEIEGENFKHYYTAIPNTEERRFKIKSYAQAIIDVDQQLLCPPLSEVTGACRIEIGHPVYSHSLFMSLDEKVYSGGEQQSSTNIFTNENLERVITSGSWLNKKTTQTENSTTNPVDALSFTFNFYTDDLTDQPPYLNYFRIASYALNNDGADYVLNNSSPGGNPAKIYLKSGECNIPDLIEMPFFYNGYKSGLKLKESYAKISHDFTSVQKFAQITGVTGGVYTLDDNPFIVGDLVSVSEINNDNGTTLFSCNSKVVSVSSGNNITLTDHSPNGTYVPESEDGLIDGTAGVMQLASGISTVSFMAYIEKGSGSGNLLKIINVSDKQFTVNNFSGVQETIENTTTYINGTVYHATGNPVKLNEWQMITLVFTNPFSIVEGTPVEITLGDPSSALATNVYIDQLMIFDKKLTTASGLGSLDNLYNSFVGNVSSNFKSTKSKEIILVDENDSITSSVQCDYLVSSGYIYDVLKSGLTTETFSITYKNSKPDLITKTAQIPAATAQATVFLSDTSSLVVGSERVDSTGQLELGTISSLDSVLNTRKVKTVNTSSGDIPKVRKPKGFISTAVTLVSGTTTNGIEVGDKVISSKYLDPGATVASKSGDVIKIKFNIPNKKYTSAQYFGLILGVPKNTTLTFVEPFPKIIMSSNLTTAVKINEKLFFRSKSYSDNLNERDKLSIGTRYIKNDDLILVVNDSESKYFLYKVTSGANEAFAIPNGSTATHTVTFTKQTLSTDFLYSVSNTSVYSYSSDPVKLSKLTATKLASLQSRVSFKLAPQYAITE